MSKLSAFIVLLLALGALQFVALLLSERMGGLHRHAKRTLR